MDPSFTRALQKIPVQLRERPGARFTVIINGRKKPEGADWSGPNGANYSITDAPLAGYLAEGHNYGILCGHAGINVPDIDDPVRLETLGIMQRIPNTMQVKTGRGGKHFYFECPELDHQIGLYDPELKDEDGDPLHLGEIQSKGQQVVGANSVHPNGNRYELVNDAPILKISKADLLAIFDGLILTGLDDPQEEPRRAEHRRRSSSGASLGDLIHIDQVAWPKDVKRRSGSEIIGSHPLHGSTSGINFSINTAKNCWHCFRCGPPKSHRGGGGPLEWLAVEAGLISCKD
ncbi:MAG: Prim-Pol protein, partial [Euryarchaeota archaeon]|nr:Prim-Pol protein [Euryarchaeota archaeon]